MLHYPTVPSGNARLRWGFSLFVAWLLLLPRIALASSDAVYGHALALGGAFAALLVLLSALDAARAGRAPRLALAFFSIMGTAVGLAFLLFSSTAVRLACFGLQMAAGIGLLLHWGRALSTLPPRELFACALAALAATALFHLLLVGAGAALSVLGNAQACSDLMLGALAMLPVASAALWLSASPRFGRERPAPPLAGDAQTLKTELPSPQRVPRLRSRRSECGTARGRLDERTMQRDEKRVAAHLLILCLTSLLASFADGFAYLPYYLDWNATASLRSCIVLAASLGGAWYLLRRPALILPQASYFTLLGLIFAVAGLSALIVNQPLASFASRAMLGVARDCSFVAALVLLCGFVRQRRLPFAPAFAAGMLGTGLCWGYDLGITVKRLLGYDLQILAPVSSLCILVLAVAFFLLFARGPMYASGEQEDPKGVAQRGRDEVRVARASGEALHRSGTATEDEHKAKDNTEAQTQGALDVTAAREGNIAIEEAADAADGGRRASDATGGERRASDEAGGELVSKPPLDALRAHEILAKAHTRALEPYRLSPRELQVSLLMLDGCTAAAASENLGISIATVKFHLGNAYRKVGIQSKAELMQVAKSSEDAARAEKERTHGE